MFANIRRHQKWLWILISGAVIISFVWYFDPSQQGGGGGSVDNTVGTIYGENISRKDYFDASKEAQLRYVFSYGEWPTGEETSRMGVSLEQQTRTRLLLLAKLKQLKINGSDEAAAEWIREIFQDRDQKTFRKDAYDRFVKETLPERGLKPQDFERFVRHEVAIQQLATVVGVAGKLIPPQEASQKYRQDHELVDTEIAAVSMSNYLAGVTVDQGALGTFFTNQASAYRVPDRVQVAYVSFPSSNYFKIADEKMNAETNLSLRIDQIYQQRGTNAFTGPTGQPLGSFEAKEKIKSEMRNATALFEARKEAIEFAKELFDLQNATNKLERLAAAKQLQVKVTEPFAQYESPAGLSVPEQFGKAAFMLTPEEPYVEEPIVGEDAVYMIQLRKRLPSELPQLATILPRVTEDYRRSQAQQMARQAGNTFHIALTNGLAQGKTFKAICDEYKMKYTKLSPFSQVTPAIPELESRGDFPQVKNAALALTPGQTSSFIPNRDGGFIVHLINRIPLSESEVQKQLPSYLAGLRRARQSDVVEDWVRKEHELAKLSMRGEKEQQ